MANKAKPQKNPFEALLSASIKRTQTSSFALHETAGSFFLANTGTFDDFSDLIKAMDGSTDFFVRKEIAVREEFWGVTQTDLQCLIEQLLELLQSI
jgi:hypothetical protein